MESETSLATCEETLPHTCSGLHVPSLEEMRKKNLLERRRTDVSATSSPIYVSIHVPTPERQRFLRNDANGFRCSRNSYFSNQNSFLSNDIVAQYEDDKLQLGPTSNQLALFRRANSCIPMACARTISQEVDEEFQAYRNAFSLPSTPLSTTLPQTPSNMPILKNHRKPGKKLPKISLFQLKDEKEQQLSSTLMTI